MIIIWLGRITAFMLVFTAFGTIGTVLYWSFERPVYAVIERHLVEDEVARPGEQILPVAAGGGVGSQLYTK